MNRRDLLKAIGIGAFGAAADLDRLLWEPGKKILFDLWTPESPQPQLVTDGWSAAQDLGAFRVGDIITFEERYVLNPVTQRPDLTRGLQPFAVTAHVEADRVLHLTPSSRGRAGVVERVRRNGTLDVRVYGPCARVRG